MAVKKSNGKRSFYEVVFQGKPKVVRAFMTGFLYGTVENASVYYNYTDGVFHEGKKEKVIEKLGLRGTDCHVIVDKETSTYLKKMTKQILADTGLAITSHRGIRSASMEIEFNAYAPKYNDEIVELVKNLPAGLRLDGYTHDVKLDPSAKGVEAYSAVHHYEACGKGSIVGQVDVLIEFKRTVAKFPLLDARDIILKMA
jgi:hypothetical protein